MKCDEARQVLMELLYPEEGLEISREFREHFSHCSGCSSEYMDLVATRHALQAWPDEEPSGALVFVAAERREGLLSRLGSWLALKPVPALAYAVLLILSLLALSGIRLTWDSGKFALQTGLFAPAALPSGTAATAEAQQGDVVAVVERMLTDSEARQNRQTLAILQRMDDSIEYKRQMDVLKVREELGLLNQNYFQTLEKNSAALEQAAKVIRLNRY